MTVSPYLASCWTEAFTALDDYDANRAFSFFRAGVLSEPGKYESLAAEAFRQTAPLRYKANVIGSRLDWIGTIDSSNLPSWRSDILQNLLAGRIGYARANLAQLCHKHPDDEESLFLYARFLNLFDERDAANDVLISLLLSRRRNGPLPLRKMPSHDIHFFPPYEKAYHYLILKGGKKDKLEEQVYLMEEARKRVRCPGCSVIEFVGYDDLDGTLRMWLTASEGQLLSQVSADHGLVKRALEFLAEYHAQMDDILPAGAMPPDQVAQVMRHIGKSRCGLEINVTDLYDILPGSPVSPIVLRSDPHQDNWWVEQTMHIFRFDLEYEGAEYASHEVAKLLYQGVETDKPFEAMESFLDDAAFYVRAFLGREPKGSQVLQFSIEMLLGSVMKSLSYYGYSFNQPEKTPMRETFLMRGYMAASILATEFKNKSDPRAAPMQRVSQAMEKIAIK
ncbi:hypothetical protein J4460_07480 [Candidatus Woesearchaeota archaeon]|nr:hypothetical protein [Candidatus Woesearchaeota archaeon]HIH37758.1 hypothetical protein [Candidatus Woesearchaeota archaeon]HIH48931.1 hypothetical protein [Candidatus Woesearchaeota archaeon]HIJ02710.1 hypothetical protein [Candidatus Woesearchaeota archaeon]